MSYLIAIATSDGENIDLSFGQAKGFTIYEVEGLSFKKKEYREAPEEGEHEITEQITKGECGTSQADTLGVSEECNNASNTSCGGGGNGCGHGGGCGGGEALPKVTLISDCRSLVARKIGFQAQKQLEKRQITSFDIQCGVDEALTKISTYFDKVDNHMSLGIR